MAALKGLSGLYPGTDDTTDYMDEGVLEAGANPLVSGHSQYGTQSDGYSGTDPTASPYSGQAVYDGYSEADAAQFASRHFYLPGTVLENTPVTHASPYPRGIIQASWGDPDALARAGMQVNEVHSSDFGGPQFFTANDPAGHEEPTDYTTDRYDAPNMNNLDPNVPGQLRSGGNSNTGKDTTQGLGELNSLPEFQMGHSIRRVQHNRMPWDFTNTHGEQDVPFLGRHPVGQMPFDGPDSPYFQMGDIAGNQVPWEGRIGYPTPYEQPVTPTIAPNTNTPDVWAWGGGF